MVFELIEIMRLFEAVDFFLKARYIFEEWVENASCLCHETRDFVAQILLNLNLALPRLLYKVLKVILHFTDNLL